MHSLHRRLQNMHVIFFFFMHLDQNRESSNAGQMLGYFWRLNRDIFGVICWLRSGFSRADLMPRSGGLWVEEHTGAPPALYNHTFLNGSECGGGPAVSNCSLYGVGGYFKSWSLQPVIYCRLSIIISFFVGSSGSFFSFSASRKTTWSRNVFFKG